MANDNPVVGEIVCHEHDYGPEKAIVKLSLKKNRLYVHCPGCGLKQQTLQPYQGWIKKNATFYEEYKYLYGDGKTYQPGRSEELKEQEEAIEEATNQGEAEKAAPETPIKKASLLSRLLSEE